MSYEIQKVMAQYCQAIDDGRIDDVARLFAEDAVLEVSAFGIRQEGRDAVSEQFRQVSGPGFKGMHCAFNPVIDIAGGTATGTFDHIWVGFSEQPQIGIVGRYHMRFRLHTDRWLIQEMRVETRAAGPLIPLQR
jgi:ketosteroid isomerase-like protein